MDDDWTPEDGSLDRMLAARKKDFKRYKFRLVEFWSDQLSTV